MRKKVLIIDDEPDVGQTVKMMLALAGFESTIATSGREGLERAGDYCPDVILLDIKMPDMDGWQACSHLRKASDAPIIILTVLGNEDQIVKGLSLGADDYVVKPWSNKELLARIHAALRRAGMSRTIRGQHTRPSGGLVTDPTRREVALGDEKIRLTPIEFRLLTYLARRSGRVVPYSELIAQVWGGKCEQDIICLRWHIHNLRRKIETDPQNPQYLLGKYGIGYCFAEQAQYR